MKRFTYVGTHHLLRTEHIKNILIMNLNIVIHSSKIYEYQEKFTAADELRKEKTDDVTLQNFALTRTTRLFLFMPVIR